MSKSTKSTLLDIGFITNNIHYGPFASYWWYSKKDPSTKIIKLYPIRLNLKMHHIKNKAEFFTTIVKGENNRPEYHCFIEDISENSENMTTAVTNVY